MRKPLDGAEEMLRLAAYPQRRISRKEPSGAVRVRTVPVAVPMEGPGPASASADELYALPPDDADQVFPPATFGILDLIFAGRDRAQSC
ncbi:MAG: hypothetical protein AB2L14_04370 [Candidatus Xenobiia bacterium LiM19]